MGIEPTRVVRVLAMWLVFGAGSAWGESPSYPSALDQELTADGLAVWVLEVNPGLASLAAAAQAAAHRIGPAGSLEDPTLSYGAAPLTANSARGLNQSFDFSQKIPWPGTLAARESVARRDAAAADGALENLRLKVVAQAKSAYAEWRFVHEALEINDATRALLDELIASVAIHYAAGRALKQDVLQAQVERGELENRELRLRSLQTTVQARINAMLNRRPHAPLPRAAPITLLPEPPGVELVEALALARHPELVRLQARMAAGESRVILAEIARYPNFQVGVGYSSLWDSADQRPMVGLSINLPLDRGKRRAEVDRARAEVRQLTWALAERRAELLADVAQASAEVLEARSSVALYEDDLVPLANEFVQASVADYQSGAGALLNVITAEQRLLGAELSRARARADYVRRLAELERWAGGPLGQSLTELRGVQP